MVIIVMGVSGSGKTLVGNELAKQLKLPFFDADDFHPEANIRKMHNGLPLSDSDRQPWLKNLALNILEWEKNGGAVLACSALKNKYRDQLYKSFPGIKLIYLKGSKSLIASRIKKRTGHFFDPSLLDSQFETLEEPDAAINVDISHSPGDIVRFILKNLE